MNSDKYDRSVKMVCSTCGCGDFSSQGEVEPVICAGCGRTFTRDELIRENGEVIEAELDEVKAQVISDVRRELKDSLKKAFSGSKYFTIK